ncbi:2-oxoglutarate-dependent dioxygenase [Lachnellula hyalina]|uniref:2-oxoglutarate-dependent dioxygenase n=1 Tax=Lachnellula hyalina TaxID=1316788 RepID=A0A8H8U3T7_9HELO|nr:2-oxoglutarate-dependent dioxygenase [Lachnellula hyalina]TVY30627.1 2-oxoglutarate-dependent dioxygenase [Lachnellula hyalina]
MSTTTTTITSTLDSEMPASNLVPTIDISPFILDPTSPLVDKIVETARKACIETGFFQITGHGISEELQSELFEASKQFFALSPEEKQSLDVNTKPGRKGYDSAEAYNGEKLPDLKELVDATKMVHSHLFETYRSCQSFFLGHDNSPDDPAVLSHRFFMGPNVWPSNSLLASSSFREPVERYFTAINNLATQVLDLVALTLPYGPDIFSNFKTGHVVAPLRLLHYPPGKPLPGTDHSNSDQAQLGAGAHTDFGAITILLQDTNPGLQVLHPKTQDFVPVPPTPGAFVVNVGDMLTAWTGGVYKSSVHRVINDNPVDRYSAAFFFNGNLDCELDPLDGRQPVQGAEGVGGIGTKGWTVEKHLIKRIQQSYGGRE